MRKINLDKGHRQRLRQKFLSSPSSLYDYEILEMLLFSAYKIKDTKPLAKTLIKNFGGFSKVINANIHELEKVPNLGQTGITIIKLAKEISTRLLKNEIEKSIILDETNKISQYCKSKIGHLRTEQLRILYINSQYRLIKDELLSEGNFSETPIYKNQIVTKATIYGAPYIILTHNHPSGDPHPSKQDLVLTQNLDKILHELEIQLLDHIIVSANDSYSIKSGNKIQFNSMSTKEAETYVNKKFAELLKNPRKPENK